MPQRKSDCRWGQACPASLSIAKSAEAEKAGATQHSPKQRSQSARRLRRPLSGKRSACSRSSDTCVSPVGCRIAELDDTKRKVLRFERIWSLIVLDQGERGYQCRSFVCTTSRSHSRDTRQDPIRASTTRSVWAVPDCTNGCSQP